MATRTVAPVATSARSRRTGPARDPVDREVEVLLALDPPTLAHLERVSALSAFQRRMEAYPVPSPQAQSALLRLVRAGEAAQAELTKPHLGRARAARAHKAVREGRRAADALVGSMFRLVLSICRERAEERFGRERAGQVLPDLVSEGLMALSQAISDYDESRGPSFATYAARVVRHRVQMIVMETATGGVTGMSSAWTRVKRIAAVQTPKLAAHLGRQPTLDELRAALREYCMAWALDRLPPDLAAAPLEQRWRAAEDKLRKQGMLGAIERLGEVLVAGQGVASLDAPVGDDGATSLVELLDPRMVTGTDDFFDPAEHADLAARLAQALAALTDRERRIIELRFGFDGGPNRTYKEIAVEFDVSSERIRQIEHKVMEKLAAADVDGSLRRFLPSLDED